VSRFRLTRRWALLSVLLLWSLLAQPAGPTLAARGAERVNSPEYGTNVFVFGERTTTDRDLAKVESLKFGWVKSLFRWDDIEHDYKGAFNWKESDRVVRVTQAAGVKLIARLDFQPWWARADNVRNGPPDDPQDFADFVYAFVKRYDSTSTIGRVQAIQIWNEPNTTREWGQREITAESAADYVRLLGLAYAAAKGADPGVTVISAGLALTGMADPTCCQPDDEYLRWMFESGLSGKYDALGVNANVQCACVSADPGSVPGFGHPSFYFRRVEQLREIMVEYGDQDKQVWLPEFGWTTNDRDSSYAWYATTEKQKGELIVEAFKYAGQNWSPWIGVMSLWTIANPRWSLHDANSWDDEEYWWAITNPDGSNRPAFERIRQARRSGELP
jgi:polysaccharide biosynthesis protein PslG